MHSRGAAAPMECVPGRRACCPCGFMTVYRRRETHPGLPAARSECTPRALPSQWDECLVDAHAAAAAAVLSLSSSIVDRPPDCRAVYVLSERCRPSGVNAPVDAHATGSSGFFLVSSFYKTLLTRCSSHIRRRRAQPTTIPTFSIQVPHRIS